MSDMMKRVLLGVSLLLALCGDVCAQKGQDQEGFVKEDRPATMKSVEEGIPAAPLVGAAYGFIWLAVLAYVVSVARRTRRLEEEIQRLRAGVAQSGGGGV